MYTRVHSLFLCAVLLLLSTWASAQGRTNMMPSPPPCSTCVTGGGTPGTVPVFASGSTATQGTVQNSNLSQDADGNLVVGANGAATGTINGAGGNFKGPLGGLTGYDTEINPDWTLVGVDGQIDNTNGYGVVGRANATTGNTGGVFGRALSVDGTGTTGVAGPTNQQNSEGGAIGVFGRSTTTSGVGTIGRADATIGYTTGVRGVVLSPNGTAGVFNNLSGGDILAGNAGYAGTGNDLVRVFRVDAAGNIYANGTLTTSTNADVAERITTAESLKPGDVVEIDPAVSGQFRRSRAAYSTMAAGIVSTAPAISLANRQQEEGADGRPMLALVGRVPVNVTSEGGAIRVGDLLTTSSTPGFAMRCADRLKCVGAIVGKALQPLASGSGQIEALVTLQ